MVRREGRKASRVCNSQLRRAAPTPLANSSSPITDFPSAYQKETIPLPRPHLPEPNKECEKHMQIYRASTRKGGNAPKSVDAAAVT